MSHHLTENACAFSPPINGGSFYNKLNFWDCFSHNICLKIYVIEGDRVSQIRSDYNLQKY